MSGRNAHRGGSKIWQDGLGLLAKEDKREVQEVGVHPAIVRALEAKRGERRANRVRQGNGEEEAHAGRR